MAGEGRIVSLPEQINRTERRSGRHPEAPSWASWGIVLGDSLEASYYCGLAGRRRTAICREECDDKQGYCCEKVRGTP